MVNTPGIQLIIVEKLHRICLQPGDVVELLIFQRKFLCKDAIYKSTMTVIVDELVDISKLTTLLLSWWTNSFLGPWLWIFVRHEHRWDIFFFPRNHNHRFSGLNWSWKLYNQCSFTPILDLNCFFQHAKLLGRLKCNTTNV